MWKHTGKSLPEFAEPVGPGQESVWAYPRPPLLIRDERQIRIECPVGVLASSNKGLKLCETASPPQFYLPKRDIRMELLTAAAGSSHCEWKGSANYWQLLASGEVVAWEYRTPREPYGLLKKHLAFYPGRLACFIDDERVRPQPGEFYGGWIAGELVGPFKGEPGTGHW